MTTKITSANIAHIASLSHIPVTPAEQDSLADGFTKTIAVVEQLNSIDVSKASTKHMTGLENVTREDEVDESRMFSQDQALQNATRTHNGFFVVDQLIQQED